MADPPLGRLKNWMSVSMTKLEETRMLVRRGALQGLLAFPFLLAGSDKERTGPAIQRAPRTRTAAAVTLQQAELTGSVTLNPSTDPSGVTDTGNINGALSTNLAVYLSPGAYYIDASITPSSGTSLFGLGTSPPLPSGTPGGAVINVVTSPAKAFSGSAAIDLSDAQDVAIRDLTIDGATGPSGLDGILLSGATTDVRLEDLLIQSVTGVGVASSATGGNTVHAKNVTVHQAGGSGFNCQTTDSTWTDCLAIGCGAQGFFISEGSENSKWTGCRAEWSTYNGFYITGGWSTGDGSGGIEIANCSTDRNGQNGLSVNASSGNSPVTVSNMMLRRDGSSSTSSGYAGVLISATPLPVVLSGITCFPGVNDDGTGNESPEYGLAVTGKPVYLGISNAFLQAVTAGTNGMTTANNCNWRAVATRTGGTATKIAVILVADSA
jgi:Right handed beta helix region